MASRYIFIFYIGVGFNGPRATHSLWNPWLASRPYIKVQARTKIRILNPPLPAPTVEIMCMPLANLMVHYTVRNPVKASLNTPRPHSPSTFLRSCARHWPNLMVHFTLCGIPESPKVDRNPTRSLPRTPFTYNGLSFCQLKWLGRPFFVM